LTLLNYAKITSLVNCLKLTILLDKLLNELRSIYFHNAVNVLKTVATIATNT